MTTKRGANLAGTWQVLSLRAAGVSLIDCEHRTPPAANEGYPYVAIPQIKDGHLDLTDARRITPEHFAEWTRKARPRHHDVILSRRCNPGETAIVPPGLECALGQNLVLLRSDGTKVFPPFLRWLVQGPEWWEQIGTFINVGAIFDSLKCADVPNFALSIPPIDEQRRIAEILGSLDDKIELNRRMNGTLEAMAGALFKSWFIDFDPVHAKAAVRRQHPNWSNPQVSRAALPDLGSEIAELFPDDFEDSKLGQIPGGWSVRTLAELAARIGSGATPRGGSKVYVDHGTALVRSQNVYDCEFRWEGLVRITPEATQELDGVTLEPEDVLFNITGASILRTCVVDLDVLPARVNQHVARIRARPPVSPRFLHLHLVRQKMKAHLLGFNAGATREAVTKGHLESIPLPAPPDRLFSAFDEIATPIYTEKQSNLRQIRLLVEARNSLLPRLLSGELAAQVPCHEPRD